MDTNQMRMAVVQGGTFSEVASSPKIADVGLVVYADAGKEIANVVSANGLNGNGLVTITLGQGETIATLIDKMRETYPDGSRIREFFAGLPAVDLTNGMCQWAPLGRMAHHLLQQNGLNSFISKKIYSPLLREAGGMLDNLEVLSLASLAGGTGGGTAMLPQDILGVLTDNSNAAVTITKLRVGGLTFHDLGQNVYRNSSARLVEEVAYTISPKRHDRETRRLFLVELPILDDNRELRSRLAAQLFQAQESSELRQKMNADVANFDIRFDSIKLWRASWRNSISPERVRSRSALRYIRELSELASSDAMSKSICRGIRVDTWTNGKTMTIDETIKSIKELKEEPDSEDIVGSFAVDGQVYAMVGPDLGSPSTRKGKRGGERSLNEVLNAEELSDPEDMEEYRRVTGGRRGLRFHLQKELENERVKLEKARKAQEDAGKRVRESIEAMYSGGWAKIVEVVKSSSSKRMRRLRQELGSYLERVKEFLLCQRVVAMLEGAILQVEANLADYQNRVSGLMSLLSEMCDESVPIIDGTAVFKPLNGVFGRLFKAKRANDKHKIMEILDSSIEYVTEHGLAQIAGLETDEPSASDIAYHLETQEPTMTGPAWGGKIPIEQNLELEFIVVPPVSEKVKSGLKQALSDLGSTKHLVTANSVAAGANIVGLKLYKVTNIADIVTPKYRHELSQAIADPHLYFLDGSDGVSAILEEVDQHYSRSNGQYREEAAT